MEPRDAQAELTGDVVLNANAPIKLPVQGAAPWLEMPLTGKPKRATYNATIVASGTRTAIVRTPANEYVGFHADTGVVGVISVPARLQWLGFGTRDRVIAADMSGALWTASSLAAARSRDAWTKQAAVPGATLWDAMPGILAASDGTRVWISTEDANSVRVVFTSKVPVRALAVRPPGTVVIRTEKNRLWVSADAGKRFARTRLRLPRLQRTGPWIWNDDSHCPAVLSADNRTWVEPTTEQFDRANNPWSWAGPLQTTTRLRGYNGQPWWTTPTYPPLPGVNAGKRRIAGRKACPRGRGPQGHGSVALGGYGRGRARNPGCTGAGCLRSAPAAAIPTTQTGFYLLSDAVCGTAVSARFCPRDKPLVRPPHTGFVNHVSGTIKIGELPQGCMPETIYSARGLGVVLCRNPEKTTIWATHDNGVWAREHSVAIDVDAIWNASTAPDGTLLLQHSCPPTATSCSATIRRPVAAGSPRAWYDVQHEGAMTHRPVVGGRVLVAIARGEDLILTLADGKQSRTLGVPVKTTARLHDLVIEDSGRLRIDGFRQDRVHSFYVTGSGRRVIASPPMVRRTTSGAIITTPRPIDPAHMGN